MRLNFRPRDACRWHDLREMLGVMDKSQSRRAAIELRQSKYKVRLSFRPRDACRWHGLSEIPSCADGVAPLSVRRITEIHAAAGRKLVALGVDRVAPLSVIDITEIHAACRRHDLSKIPSVMSKS